jgi:hypothetical protein
MPSSRQGTRYGARQSPPRTGLLVSLHAQCSVIFATASLFDIHVAEGKLPPPDIGQSYATKTNSEVMQCIAAAR